MASGISILGGLHDEPGGLDETMAEFVRHHDRVGKSLMNISGWGTPDGLPAKKDAERMPYVYQAFPKMIYHAEKGDTIVDSKEELALHLKEGWREKPYPKPQVAVLDPAVEKKAIMDDNARLRGVLAQQTEALERFQARLDTLEKK